MNGQAIFSFNVNPLTYLSSQTVCMANSENGWNSDLCLTSVQPESFSVTCTCNAFLGERVALFTDGSKQLGEPIDFPQVEQKITVNTEIQLTPVGPSPPAIKGASYLFITSASIVALFGLIGSLIAAKMDKGDIYQREKVDVSELEARIATATASALNEPESLVQMRRQTLIDYKTSIL